MGTERLCFIMSLVTDKEQEIEILLLSQEAAHPFYGKVYDYFAEPLSAKDSPRGRAVFKTPQLGITLLATALNSSGIKTLPIHNFLAIDASRDLFARCLGRKPLAVGISTTHFFNNGALLSVMETIKRVSPDTKIIIGGSQASENPAALAAADIIIPGCAETGLVRTAAALRENTPLSSVPGILYREGGLLRRNPGRIHTPVNEVPEPDWSLYGKPPDAVSVQGSRGCSRGCAFCSYREDGFELRSPEKVLSEISGNINRHGISFMRFTDSDFAADPAWARAVCGGILDRGLRFSWTCFARADSLLEPGLAGLMRRAGCQWVFIGAESGSDRILASMEKGAGTETIKAGIAAAKAAGLLVHANFVVGYPGEDSKTLKETFDFSVSCGADTVFYSPFQVRSKSIPVYARREEFGLSSDGGHGWEHAGMNSDEAVNQAAAMLKRLALSAERPLPASEIVFSYMCGGTCPDFSSEVLTLLTAFRDYHRARTAADPGATARNLDIILG